jgi:hypothetical protein
MLTEHLITNDNELQSNLSNLSYRWNRAIPVHQLIAKALHMNNDSSHVVVATTHIDCLAAGKRYLEAYCEDRRQRAIRRKGRL